MGGISQIQLCSFRGYYLCVADTNPQYLFFISRVATAILTSGLPSPKPVLRVISPHSTGTPLLRAKARMRSSSSPSPPLDEAQAWVLLWGGRVPTAQGSLRKCLRNSSSRFLCNLLLNKCRPRLCRGSFSSFPPTLLLSIGLHTDTCLTSSSCTIFN